jgi:hypothetical protein
MKDQPYESVSLVMHPQKGSSIGEVSAAAIQLAATEWRNVSFTFNDQKYSVCVNDLLAQVKKA